MENEKTFDERYSDFKEKIVDLINTSGIPLSVVKDALTIIIGAVDAKLLQQKEALKMHE